MSIDGIITSFKSKFFLIQSTRHLKILKRNSTLCFHDRETEFGACLEQVQKASSIDFKDWFECTCMQKLDPLYSKIVPVVKVGVLPLDYLDIKSFD